MKRGMGQVAKSLSKSLKEDKGRDNEPANTCLVLSGRKAGAVLLFAPTEKLSKTPWIHGGGPWIHLLLRDILEN